MLKQGVYSIREKLEVITRVQQCETQARVFRYNDTTPYPPIKTGNGCFIYTTFRS